MAPASARGVGALASVRLSGPRARLASVRIILAGIVLAGCSGVTTTPSTTAIASPTATASVSSEPSTPAASPSPACDGTTLCDGPVNAGAYTFSVGGRSIQLELEDGWRAEVGPSDTGVQLVREGTDVQGLSFNGFTGRVFGSPCAGRGASETVDATPDAFMTYFAARDGISVQSPPSAVTVGGQPALQVDATVQLPSSCPDETGDNFIFGVGADGEFVLQPGESARMVAVGGDGEPIIIALESSSEAGYRDLLDAATAIFATMSIG